MGTADSFVRDLQAYTPSGHVCNPWRDCNPAYDMDDRAPAVRAEQLLAYLAPRWGRARYLLIAEAVGYQGARFSGVAMTSERMLLGRCKGIEPNWVAPGFPFRRTSLPAVKPEGFTEPTATIVWSTMRDHGIPPGSFLLWNAFPFHPYNPAKGPLSNRTPTPSELADGSRFARRLVAACAGARVIAVGAKSAGMLTDMGIAHTPVRHPANGGATEFRANIRALIAQ